MSWFSKTFGGGGNYSNPADAAMPYMEQIPGQVDKYYNPFINLGQSQGNAAAGTYNKMAQDPTAYVNDFMSDYDQSDWEQYQEDEMTDQASASAAQGGYAGTEQDMKNQEELTQGLLSKDQQQWYNNVMGAVNTGLSGEQAMYKTGFQASNQAADANISNLSAEGGLAYKGQENENAYNASQINSFLKALGQGAGMAGNWATDLMTKPSEEDLEYAAYFAAMGL